MARPKGSKNKKNLLSVEQITKKLDKKQEEIAALRQNEQEVLAQIEVQKGQLKAVRKEIRKANKAIAALQQKAEDAKAAEDAVAKKKEIENVVSKIISSGRSAEEILEKLGV